MSKSFRKARIDRASPRQNETQRFHPTGVQHYTFRERILGIAHQLKCTQQRTKEMEHENIDGANISRRPHWAESGVFDVHGAQNLLTLLGVKKRPRLLLDSLR